MLVPAAMVALIPGTEVVPVTVTKVPGGDCVPDGSAVVPLRGVVTAAAPGSKHHAVVTRGQTRDRIRAIGRARGRGGNRRCR